MKVLHCIWSLPTGGLEEMLIDIMKLQVEAHEVHLVIVNDDYEPEMLRKVPGKVKVHRIGRRPGNRNPWPVVKLNMLVLGIRPDVIHMHNREMASIILPKTRWHKVLTVHDVGIELIGHKYTRRIAAISEAVKQDLSNRYGIDSTTIINGIATENIAVRGVKPYSDTFRIVQVGRLFAEKKGQDLLIRAVAMLYRKGYNDLRLTLIGDGNDMDSLKQIAKAEGVDEIVEFAGRKDKKYIYEHMADYDLMVHPARWEGFGLVIAEAMVAQLPVAVTDEGGPYEVTDRGRFALTFATDDLAGCANVIAEAHDDYQKLLANVQEARRYAIEHYSIRRTVDEYLELYASI